ncbi:MAG: KTSC domain-containing protein [Ignavibacteria bacterium]|nr:KTSC domain-containing protein [Ignavibacteria bacterium]
MNRESVQSSMIASLGYDANISTLEVEFNSGAVWQYYDVPESIYYDLMNSGSQGKFFHSNIKGQYNEAQVG